MNEGDSHHDMLKAEGRIERDVLRAKGERRRKRRKAERGATEGDTRRHGAALTAARRGGTSPFGTRAGPPTPGYPRGGRGLFFLIGRGSFTFCGRF